MSRVITYWPLGDIPGRKKGTGESFLLSTTSGGTDAPGASFPAVSIPALSDFRWLFHQSMSPSPRMFGALGSAGLVGHELPMSTKTDMEQLSVFPKLL